MLLFPESLVPLAVPPECSLQWSPAQRSLAGMTPTGHGVGVGGGDVFIDDVAKVSLTLDEAAN